MAKAECYRWIWKSVLVGFSLLALGCTDERMGKESKSPTEAPQNGAETEHALRVLVSSKTSGDRWVKIRPVEWDAWTPGVPEVPVEIEEGEALAAERTSAATEPPKATLALVEGPDGSVDTKKNDASAGYATGWTLLHWATRSCFDATIKPTASLHVDPAPWLQFGPPASAPFYLLHDTFSHIHSIPSSTGVNCDEALFIQEVLLCASDRLAQIARHDDLASP
jgi:hypothetical protein